MEGDFDINKEVTLSQRLIQVQAGYVIMNILSKRPDFIPVEDLKQLIPGYLGFLSSHDYELAELGLQFFISVLRHFPVSTVSSQSNP